jgi:1-acyl-sn-glycerol-3-phosphate acyltransferase
LNVIRSQLFTLFLFLSTLVAAILIIASATFSKTRRFRIAYWWARANLWMVRWMCGVDFTVEGLDNLTRKDAIIYWKHQSTFETIALFTVTPDAVPILKRELMWLPVVGWALSVMGFIPIDRSSGRTAVNQVVKFGTRSLEQGRPVVIFPEGTRVMPGKTRRYGISGALLASRSGRPILPIAHNAGDFWPRRGLRKNPGTIRVVIGSLIETADRDPSAINQEVQAWIEGTMRRISLAYARDDTDHAPQDALTTSKSR